jgi:predicted enzyme related to lactoylglutathione lyase
MSKMNPVVHFELPAENKKRMVGFYTNVFGWQTQQLGADMGEYVVVTTTEPDAKGRPKTPGAINGGFYQKTDDPNTQHPSVVIAVDNINESIQKVKKAGGKVLGEPTEIPGVGMFVAFFDTEGNRLSILQPLSNM